jgi:hypothetical protein
VCGRSDARKNLLHFVFALIEDAAKTSDVGFDLSDWLVVF